MSLWSPLFQGLVLLAGLGTLAVTEASEVTVQSTADGLRIENGLVRLDYQRTEVGVRKSFYALDAAAEWKKVCSSFVADFRSHPDGNAFFDTSRTPARYAVHEVLPTALSIEAQSPGRVVVRVAGSARSAEFSEITTLLAGEKHFHVSVSAVLPTNVLDSCVSSYLFESDGVPEFVHSPTVKKDEYRWANTPASGQVLGDMAFHSPAVILQTGGLFAALVPDLECINRDQVRSPQARRTRYVGKTPFDTPEDPAGDSMPTALDLNLVSGLTPSPVFSYGMMDYLVSHHMRYYRTNDASMLRTLATNRVTYAFDLFLGAREPARCGYQQISRYLWDQYGGPYFREQPHLALPFAEYVKLVYSVVSRPMPADVQPPVPGYEDQGAFLDFTLEGQPVCGLVAPLGVLGFGDALWNSVFWNPVRDASGMHHWGRRLGNPEMTTRARNIINLALLSPRNEQGLFCLTYLAKSRTWLRGTVNPEARSIFSKTNDTYDIPALSKTATHLLHYYQECEPDPRILAYLKPYADWVAGTIDAEGRIPSYFTADMKPKDPFAVNAQAAASLGFLAEFHAITNHPGWLAAALRTADYLTREVVPNQRWTDLEPYFSCGQNPNTFTNDAVQGMPVRGNLSTLWAAEAFAALYRVTGSNQFLVTGERLGLGPENINHEGHNQSAMRTHPSWGECSAIFTGLAVADRLMGGGYVQGLTGVGVGVDGVTCTNRGLDGKILSVQIANQLAKHRAPWSTPFRTTLRIVGLNPEAGYAVRINGLPPIALGEFADGLIPVVLQTNGTVTLAREVRAVR